MAGHKSVQRYFRKFGQATNQRVFQELYRWFFEHLHFDNFTLDLDSTVMSRYGQQEGTRRGYNPRKPGRNSHHPLLAFVADCRMVANCWLRSGDAHTANNFEGFLQDTLEHLAGKKVGLLRADSGFCQKTILEYLEEPQHTIPYIIATRLHAPVQRMLAAHRQWFEVEEGIEVASVLYGYLRLVILVEDCTAILMSVIAGLPVICGQLDLNALHNGYQKEELFANFE